MDIGIVTSFYNGYDRFIPRWVNSVCSQTVKPSKIVLVASGKVEDIKNLKYAEKLLKESRIPYIISKIAVHKSMGNARNRAVRICNTEWIMYLDADDTILPDGIQNIIKYEDRADVICTGLRYVGELRHKEILYLHASKERVLNGEYCSCSHSPFRKKFWKQNPYIEYNDYVEQILWIGLAQAGARFKGTKEICTVYHRRKNGHNKTMTKKQWKECRFQKSRFLKNGVVHK